MKYTALESFVNVYIEVFLLHIVQPQCPFTKLIYFTKLLSGSTQTWTEFF